MLWIIIEAVLDAFICIKENANYVDTKWKNNHTYSLNFNYWLLHNVLGMLCHLCWAVNQWNENMCVNVYISLIFYMIAAWIKTVGTVFKQYGEHCLLPWPWQKKTQHSPYFNTKCVEVCGSLNKTEYPWSNAQFWDFQFKPLNLSPSTFFLH